MKLLIDTQMALWLFNEHEKLSQTAREYLNDESNELFISVVSSWEVAIKHSLGKLSEFKGGVKRFNYAVSTHPIETIGIMPEHVEKYEELPFYHRDPFDRLIIATAICEDMTILTSDENIRKYNVRCKW
jgi:PIN domain nuclease of toxin-antitoxin system